MTKHLSEVPKRPTSLGIELPALVEDALMRSLSKRAEDRFESARDMRKLLEQALKDADIGLVETQRVSRDLLKDVAKDGQVTAPNRPAKPALTPVPPRRVSTPNDIADELEPGASGSRPRKSKRNAMLAIAFSALVLAGGAATVMIVLRTKHYQPVLKLSGVAVTQGKKVGPILFETDATMTPDEVAGQYRLTLDGLRAVITKALPDVTIADPVAEIVTVGRSVLCDPQIVPDVKQCQTAPWANVIPTVNGPRVLMIINDRTRLGDALRGGLGDAVCLYESTSSAQTAQQICKLTNAFAARVQ
jgi:hypothetical protein